MSRTDSSHFSNHGMFLNLAKSPVIDVSETVKIIRTYQKIYFNKWPFLYCFRKTPSKFAFFFRKMAKYGLKFSITFLKKNYKSYKSRLSNKYLRVSVSLIHQLVFSWTNELTKSNIVYIYNYNMHYQDREQDSLPYSR